MFDVRNRIEGFCSGSLRSFAFAAPGAEDRRNFLKSFNTPVSDECDYCKLSITTY